MRLDEEKSLGGCGRRKKRWGDIAETTGSGVKRDIPSPKDREWDVLLGLESTSLSNHSLNGVESNLYNSVKDLAVADMTPSLW